MMPPAAEMAWAAENDIDSSFTMILANCRQRYLTAGNSRIRSTYTPMNLSEVVTMAAIDLNLIRVCVIVYESRNLTRAARDLYVTQSAISQSLSRLRKHFGDPLFARLGRRMEPTPVAQEAYLDMRAALDSIDTALGRVQRFDPSTSEKVFRIALSELGEIGWMGNILGEVRRSAPNVRIESIALDQSRFVDWLER